MNSLTSFLFFSIALFVFLGCTSMQQHRETYVANHPDLPSETQEAILNGKVVKNMTQEQVQMTWGPPTKIVATELEGRDVIVWFYDNPIMTHPHKIVSFKDGKVFNYME